MPVWIKETYGVIRDTGEGFINHDGTGAASVIAYTLLFAIFPFVILVVLTATTLGGEALADAFENQILAAMPEHIVRTLGPELNNVLAIRGTGSIFTLGVAAIFVTLSGLVETVRWALNQAYGLQETRSILRRRLLGLLFVVAVVLGLIVVAALGVVIPIVWRLAEPHLPMLQDYAGLINAVRWVLLTGVVFVLLLALHRVLPARRPPLSHLLPGVALTLVAWLASGSLFGFYLNQLADLGATYGGLAGIIGLMLFFQILAMAFILGGEFNRAIADHRGVSTTEPTRNP